MTSWRVCYLLDLGDTNKYFLQYLLNIFWNMQKYLSVVDSKASKSRSFSLVKWAKTFSQNFIVLFHQSVIDRSLIQSRPFCHKFNIRYILLITSFCVIPDRTCFKISDQSSVANSRTSSSIWCSPQSASLAWSYTGLSTHSPRIQIPSLRSWSLEIALNWRS